YPSVHRASRATAAASPQKDAAVHYIGEGAPDTPDAASNRAEMHGAAEYSEDDGAEAIAADIPPDDYGSHPRRLLFLVNNPAFFLSHRLPIALAARDA